MDNVDNVDNSIKRPKQSDQSKQSKQSKLIVEDARQPAEKPVSLHPVKFEEAVANLIRVKPDSQRHLGRSSGGGCDNSLFRLHNHEA